MGLKSKAIKKKKRITPFTNHNPEKRIGERYGHCVIVEYVGRICIPEKGMNHFRHQYKLRCDCGNEILTTSLNLKKRKYCSKECPLNLKATSERFSKNGYAKKIFQKSDKWKDENFYEAIISNRRLLYALGYSQIHYEDCYREPPEWTGIDWDLMTEEEQKEYRKYYDELKEENDRRNLKKKV